MINVQRLRPRQFAWSWRGDQRILLVGLWFFAVGIDFGLQRSPWFKHFTQTCNACGQSMNILSRFQRIKWHKQCRKEGRRIEHRRIKQERKK